MSINDGSVFNLNDIFMQLYKGDNETNQNTNKRAYIQQNISYL